MGGGPGGRRFARRRGLLCLHLALLFRLLGHFLLPGLENRLAVEVGFGHRLRDQTDRPQGVVVAGDDVIDGIGVAVGIGDADDRNPQLGRFLDGDRLHVGVDDEQRVGEGSHVLDAGKVLFQLLALALVPGHFLLGKEVVLARAPHRLQFAEALDALLDRHEVGQQPPQPSLVDVVQCRAARRFLDHFLGLPLGAEEQNRLPLGSQLVHELNGLLEQLEALLQIDDVDAVPLPEDIFLHLRIPAFGLVAEVHPGFQQLFHGYRNQVEPPRAIVSRIGISCEPPSDRISFVP